MSIDNGSNRLEDEAEHLLSEHSHQQPDSNVGISHAFQYSLYASQAAKATLNLGKISVLLVFVPLGILASTLRWPPITVLIFNLVAIIPLSALVSYSVDELVNYVGDLIGELINATFGNAVELIVGIVALSHGDIRFAQSTMLGSILSDILVVLGICLFSAAYSKQLPTFNMAMADAMSSLMIITATALILPTALYSTFTSSESTKFGDSILTFSRGSALVLLVLYLMYLNFQLRTHTHLFLDAPEGESESATNENENGNGTEQQQEPTLSVYTASAVLIIATIGVMGCTHLLFDSVGKTAQTTDVTKMFIATILIPIASNAPECATILVASQHGKIDFAIGVIVGSVLQIALFVIPFLVILGWIIQQPMTLYFETFEVVILFFAVLVVNRLLQDGIYTYIQGAMLVALYAVVATAFYLRPEAAPVPVNPPNL